MGRKGMLVLVALAVVAVGFLVIRYPIGSAETVQRGWELLIGALRTVADSLSTFLWHLFQG